MVLNRRDQLTRLVNIHIYMWVEQKYIKHKDLYMNIEQFLSLMQPTDPTVCLPIYKRMDESGEQEPEQG